MTLTGDNPLRAALDELGIRREKGWYAKLRNSLKSGSADQRMFAALLLGDPGEGADQRASWLREILDDREVDVRLAAVESLEKLGLPGTPSVTAVAQRLLVETDGRIVRIIIRALGNLGSRLWDAKGVLDSAVAENRLPESVRMSATSVLGRMGRTALDSLCQALTLDRCSSVREIAALAVREIARDTELTTKDAAAISSAMGVAVRRENEPAVLELIAEASESLSKRSAYRSHSPTKDVAQNRARGYVDSTITEQRGEREMREREEQQKSSVRSARIAKLKTLIDETPPESYPKAQAKARELLTLTKQEIADRLTEPLVKRVQNMPQETYGDKKAVASWVNAELRELGLAIRCLKTGKPAILIADIRGNSEEQGSRFRVEVTADEGRKVRTWSGDDLVEYPLELREDLARKEGPTVRRSKE